MGLSVLYHLHVILELGLAAVTLHSNVAVCPSVTLYGLNALDVTSGLSKVDVIYIYIPFNAFKTTCFTLINRTFICLNVKLIILLTLHVYIYILSGSDVPTTLLAMQLKNPEFILCIFENV